MKYSIKIFLAAMIASDWWTLTVFFVAIAGTLLAGLLPWWLSGPCTFLLITLLSRGHGSAMRRVEHRLTEGSKLAERYHAEHRARLDDIELVASYGPGKILPGRSEGEALNDARLAVANRIGRRHPD